MTTEMETWLSDSRAGNNGVVDHRSRRPVLFALRNCVDSTMAYYEINLYAIQQALSHLILKGIFSGCIFTKILTDQ